MILYSLQIIALFCEHTLLCPVKTLEPVAHCKHRNFSPSLWVSQPQSSTNKYKSSQQFLLRISTLLQVLCKPCSRSSCNTDTTLLFDIGNNEAHCTTHHWKLGTGTQATVYFLAGWVCPVELIHITQAQVHSEYFMTNTGVTATKRHIFSYCDFRCYCQLSFPVKKKQGLSTQ